MSRSAVELAADLGLCRFGKSQCAVICCLVLLLAPVASVLSQDAAQAPLSRFQRTAAYLQGAPAPEQTDFASAALTELAAVYMAEADLARAQAATLTGNGRARLLGWSVAVDQYANDLMLALDDLELGLPVSVRTDQQGPAAVTVAGKLVILGHPRADQQSAFEQRVLQDFCSLYDCEQIATSPTGKEHIPMTASRVNPRWTFAEGGSVCANEGLEVYFPSAGKIATWRGLCDELAQETVALATAIVWQIRYGVDIDWDDLEITPTPERPEHLVRLNTAGDSIVLTLPLLHSSPDLLADITPWLHGRAIGGEAAVTRLDASLYGWTAGSQ